MSPPCNQSIHYSASRELTLLPDSCGFSAQIIWEWPYLAYHLQASFASVYAKPTSHKVVTTAEPHHPCNEWPALFYSSNLAGYSVAQDERWVRKHHCICHSCQVPAYFDVWLITLLCMQDWYAVLQVLAWAQIGMQENCKWSRDLNPPIESKLSCDILASIGGFKSCDLWQFCIPIFAEQATRKHTTMVLSA